MLGTFPNAFSQATTCYCIFTSGNLPNVLFPKRQLAHLEGATWEIVTWEVALGKLPFGKYLTPFMRFFYPPVVKWDS